MDQDALIAKGFHPNESRLACALGFQLRIGQRATLVPDPSSHVYGFAMQLTQEEIAALYADSSLSAYRAEAIVVRYTDGSTAPALCFNLTIPPDLTETNPLYASQLRDLVRRLGLPAQYVARIC